jgi:hypothetical protein
MKSIIYVVCRVVQLFNFIFLLSIFGNVLVTKFILFTFITSLLRRIPFSNPKGLHPVMPHHINRCAVQIKSAEFVFQRPKTRIRHAVPKRQLLNL